MKHEDVEVILLPVLEDNYAFIVVNRLTNEAILIDSPDFAPIEKLLRKRKLHLVAILNTHHHGDHVGGNLEFAKTWPQLEIYGFGPDAHRIPGITHQVNEQTTLLVSEFRFSVLETPGHTRGHICFLLEASGQTHLFCGDTLFGAGCGKLFEGTHTQMLNSLKKLRSLPSDALVWCAHEYTEKNLWVAMQLEPANQHLALAYNRIRELRASGQPSVPLTLRKEIEINPFLRWDCPLLRETLKTTNDLETFQFVREFRDKF